MKYRWICKFLILNERPPLRTILSREDNFLSSSLNRSIVHATRSSIYCSRCLSHFWLTSPYLGLVWHVDILCFTCVGARYPLSGLSVLSFVKYCKLRYSACTVCSRSVSGSTCELSLYPVVWVWKHKELCFLSPVSVHPTGKCFNGLVFVFAIIWIVGYFMQRRIYVNIQFSNIFQIKTKRLSDRKYVRIIYLYKKCVVQYNKMDTLPQALQPVCCDITRHERQTVSNITTILF